MTTADSDKPAFIPGYRIRLRFFTSGAVKSDLTNVEFTLEGHSAKLSGRDENVPVNSQEIKLNIYGVANEVRATHLAQRLVSAISLSSALSSFGVNLGEDRPTTALAHGFRLQLESQSDVKWRDNIHGLDIFNQAAPTVYFEMGMTGSTSIGAQLFLDRVRHVLPWVDRVTESLSGIAGMLNAADFSTSEVTKIGICMSAIENLAPRLEWNDAQKASLERAKAVIDTEAGDNEELEVMAQAVSDLQKGPSLGASLRALLTELNLSDHWKELRTLRIKRGIVMHGRGLKRDELIDIAARTRNMAQTIFKAALAQRGLPTSSDPLT